MNLGYVSMPVDTKPQDIQLQASSTHTTNRGAVAVADTSTARDNTKAYIRSGGMFIRDTCSISHMTPVVSQPITITPSTTHRS